MNLPWLKSYYVPVPRYTLLAPGDMILPGDEFYSEGEWRRTRVTRPTIYVPDYKPYRRRLT